MSVRLAKVILLLIFCFAALPHLSFAEEPESTSDDQEATPIEENEDEGTAEQGGVELKSEEYDSNNYIAITHIESNWNPFSGDAVDQALNGLANIFFSLTKSLAHMIDMALSELYAIAIVDEFINIVAPVSEQLGEVLYENFGVILFLIAVIQIFVHYVGQRNGSKAGRTSLVLFLIIGLNVLWFSNTETIVRSLNDISTEAQSQIMGVGVELTNEDVQSGNELEGTQAILRNHFFMYTVEMPYLLMNYGVTEAGEQVSEERIDQMLSLPVTQDGYEQRESLAEDEVLDHDNYYMSQSNVYSKVGITFLSIVFVITLGAPILLIAMINMLLELLILLMTLFIPISLTLALLPSFSNSVGNAFGQLFGVFFMKIFVGFILLLTFLAITIVEAFIPPTNAGFYMLNVMVTSVVLILMIAFRKKLIRFVSAGRVSMDGGNIGNQMYTHVRNARMATAGAGFLLGRRSRQNQQANQQENQQPQQQEYQPTKARHATSSNRLAKRKDNRSRQGNEQQNVVDMQGYKNQRNQNDVASERNVQRTHLSKRELKRERKQQRHLSSNRTQTQSMTDEQRIASGQNVSRRQMNRTPQSRHVVSDRSHARTSQAQSIGDDVNYQQQIEHRKPRRRISRQEGRNVQPQRTMQRPMKSKKSKPILKRSRLGVRRKRNRQ
uniref:CD3337/EF1877 family mobilome membrane protein n=1 Tax=Bacillaceae bacterium JMAK1 TaxID=1028381 RepID=UPI0003AC27D3|nr:hypothetical protein [Bacillaceae bacterium JMAK1]AGQ45429.1 Putative membrane protein [Bacillaceae bacterium JMAK1]